MFSDLFPLNRVVALLTPPIAILAGTLAAWFADHAPFIAEQVDQGEIQGIFIGGVITVLGVAYKWLDNWAPHEARVAAGVVDKKGNPVDPEDPHGLAGEPPEAAVGGKFGESK